MGVDQSLDVPDQLVSLSLQVALFSLGRVLFLSHLRSFCKTTMRQKHYLNNTPLFVQLPLTGYKIWRKVSISINMKDCVIDVLPINESRP